MECRWAQGERMPQLSVLTSGGHTGRCRSWQVFEPRGGMAVAEPAPEDQGQAGAAGWRWQRWPPLALPACGPRVGP